MRRTSILSGFVLACCFGLPLVVPAFAQGQGELDRGDFGPFVRALNNTSYGYTVVKDPTGDAPAPMVERFEVCPGDCAANGDWDDCVQDRERSEVMERDKVTQDGQDYWYGWSFYLPSDWTSVWPTKTALGQFHQWRSHPLWMFRNDRGALLLDRQVSGRTEVTYPLASAETLRGHWTRMEVHARWSHGEDGFLRVYVNGQQKVDYTGRTMTAQAVYFRYGIYRSFLSRYKNTTGAAEVPPQTAYYANVRRARSREGLR